METQLQGNPVSLQKKKKKKAAGRERAQGMAKLWLQKENGGYKSLSFFTQDAGMEAELWALGCERLLKGGWVQAALLILSCAPLVFFLGGGVVLSGWWVC